MEANQSTTGNRKSREAQGKGSAETALFVAVRMRNAGSVRQLAKQAGLDRDRAAVRSLCDFLVPPSYGWKTPRTGKRGWGEARAAAVWALKEIGDPMALPALALTLATDRDPVVREAARVAVESFGSAATPVLLAMLRESVDWKLAGMKAVIECLVAPADLSGSQKKSIGAALAHVLFEHLPEMPTGASARQTARGIIVFILSTLALAVVSSTAAFSFYPVLFLIVGSIAASVISSSKRKRNERRLLNAAAGDALLRLNDKRAIPSLIELGCGTPVWPARGVARNVLITLLPQMEAQDAGLLSSLSLEYLHHALGSRQSPSLTMAILKALEAVGTGNSIKPVARLAKWGQTPEIKAEALRVQAILEARQERVTASKSLLRGSEAPTSGSEELLRAATRQIEAHPEQLLRPTE